MREEVISSGGTIDPTPAASSAGASSPAVPMNVGSIDGSSHGQVSKAASLSCVGSQPPWASLSTSAGGSAFGSSRSSCRPWERGDLLRRLATFIPLNWLGKPQIISSLACAQKGWMNNGVDKIACESCGACLSFTALPSWTSAEAQNASESFARQLDSGHNVNCPWKGNNCPESLVQFPPTPPSALIGGYKDRCDGLVQFHCLPVVAISAIELMSVSHGPQIERFLSQSQNFMSGEVDIKPEIISEFENSQDEAYCLYSRAQKLISLCGWEPSWLLNVQDCEEHSAQSERNGYSFGPSKTQLHLTQDPGPKAVSASTKLDARKSKSSLKESRLDTRSPLLDCSLCGATVRILDFLTVPRPTRFAPNSIDIPDTSKKIGLTRGASAASGISGWIAADDTEKDQTEDRDEVATTNEGKLLANTDLDLNLTMAGVFPFTPLGRTATSEYAHDEDMGRDLMIGQPSGSEIGDRAASYESRGPSSRKRNLEKGGSSDYQPVLRLQQQADSVEGTVIDRDGDEVTDGGQYSAGPSKRARDSDIFDTYCSPHQRDSSGAGPSHSMGFDAYVSGNRVSSFHQGNDRPIGIQSARDSTRASSVIAMDTICHSVNGDSMESVENYPGDLDDVHFPSSSTYGNVDMNETSELNNSNQAQQSTCLQTATEVVPGEVGVSSTNYGEELFNAETVIAQARDGISLGISGGSVGMCASHEAEIHGADISVHRADSVVGEMEQRVEDAEHQGQTGESVPGPGLMDEIIPDDVNREDPIGDNQEMMSHSAGRTDSGSKIGCSTKAESVESGEKISQNCNLLPANNCHPSRSCNANISSGCENTKDEIMKDGKSSFANNCALLESDFAIANGIGPPKGESNYEAVEFDPIVYHNQCCPWVNGNVAAAGCASSVPSTGSDAIAFCGWQLTLDALDALQSLGHNAIPTVPSESAASLYKQNDQQAPGKKLFRNHSMSRSHGQL
ncbi:Nuclear-interacting partner of ALK, partial [Mucuna pruriens]